MIPTVLRLLGAVRILASFASRAASVHEREESVHPSVHVIDRSSRLHPGPREVGEVLARRGTRVVRGVPGVRCVRPGGRPGAFEAKRVGHDLFSEWTELVWERLWRARVPDLAG